MRTFRFRKAAAGAAVACLAVVGWAVPASSADSGPMGYTSVMTGEGTCELATIDLSTGQLTDLPAAASSEACVSDLAVTPGGQVWGITGFGLRQAGLAPQAEISSALVSFAADGTPTTVPISVAAASEGSTIVGGIAVAPNGTVYAHLVTDDPGCDTGTPRDTIPDIAPLYAGDSVCLYTVDPATGAATIVGTTGLFETPFTGLSWCGGLVTFAFEGEVQANWATESTTDGAVTVGAAAEYIPVGYDCDSSTGSPLYGLLSPNGGGLLPNASTPAATETSLVTIDPATGVPTLIAPLSDPNADVMALAVTGQTVVTPTTAGPAVAADTVAPAFTG